MFGKEKQPENFQSNWANQIETAQWSADELALAHQLHDLRPDLAHMPPAARQKLRQHLITSHNRQHNRFYIALRYAMTSAAVALLVGLLVFAKRQLNSMKPEQWSLFQIPVVEEKLPAGQLIYEQATVAKEGESSRMFVGLPLYDEETIESWYTPDFSSYRYQITSRSGQIVYFEEWHDTHWIYPIYDLSAQSKVFDNPDFTIQPQLVEATIDESAKERMGWNDVSWLLDGFVEVDWLRLSLLIKKNQLRCSDPFCLLGIDKADGRWQCEAHSCTRKLSESGGIEIELNRIYSNDQNYAIDITKYPNGGNWFRLLIARTSLNLIELSERQWDGRKALVIRANDGVSKSTIETVFESLPESLQMANPTYRLQQPLSARMRYQLKSISPKSGTSIHQPTEVQAVIEYAQSQYVRNNTISVGLVARDQIPGQPLWQGNSDETVLKQPEGVVTLTVTIDPSRMRNTLWDLQVIPSLPGMGFQDVNSLKNSWCVGCDMKTYPIMELSAMYPMSDKISLNGTTSVADGTCLYSQLFLQYQDSMGGKPVPWWNSERCVKVKQGYWQIDIDRKEIPADAQSFEQIYSLKVWSSDSPQHPTFFWIGTLTSPEVFGSR